MFAASNFDFETLTNQITPIIDALRSSEPLNIKQAITNATSISAVQTMAVFGVLPILFAVLFIVLCVPVYLGVECCSPGVRFMRRQRKLDKLADKILAAQKKTSQLAAAKGDSKANKGKKSKKEKLGQDPVSLVFDQTRGSKKGRTARFQKLYKKHLAKTEKSCGPQCCSRCGCTCYMLWWAFAVIDVVGIIMCGLSLSTFSEMPRMEALKPIQSKVNAVVDSVVASADGIIGSITKSSVNFMRDFTNSSISDDDISLAYIHLRDTLLEFPLANGAVSLIDSLLDGGENSLQKWVSQLVIPPQNTAAPHMASWADAAAFFVGKLRGLETQLNRVESEGELLASLDKAREFLATMEANIKPEIVNSTNLIEQLDSFDVSVIPSNISSMIAEVAGDIPIGTILDPMVAKTDGEFDAYTAPIFGHSLKAFLTEFLDLTDDIIKQVVDLLLPYEANGSVGSFVDLFKLIQEQAGFDLKTLKTMVSDQLKNIITEDLIDSLIKYRKYIILGTTALTGGLDSLLTQVSDIMETSDIGYNLLKSVNSTLENIPFKIPLLKTDSIENLASSAMIFPLLLCLGIPLIALLIISLCMGCQVKCCSGCSMCCCGFCSIFSSIGCLALMAASLASAIMRPQLSSMKSDFTKIPNVALGLSVVQDKTASIGSITFPSIMSAISFQPASITPNMASIEDLLASIKFNVSVNLDQIAADYLPADSGSNSMTDKIMKIVRDIVTGTVNIEIDLTGTDLSKIFSDTPTAFLNCIKLSKGKSIPTIVKDAIGKLTTKTLLEENLFSKIDLDKIEEKLTPTFFKDLLYDYASLNISKVSQTLQNAIDDFGLQSVVDTLEDIRTKIEEFRSLLDVGDHVDIQDFSATAWSAIDTFFNSSMTEADQADFEGAMSVYQDGIVPAAVGLVTVRSIYSNLFLEYMADSGNWTAEFGTQTGSDVLNNPDIYAFAASFFRSTDSQEWYDLVEGEPAAADEMEEARMKSFFYFEKTEDCDNFKADLEEAGQTPDFTCETWAQEYIKPTISDYAWNWLAARNISTGSYDEVAVQLVMPPYGCRDHKSDYDDYAGCLKAFGKSVVDTTQTMKGFLKLYFMQLSRRTLITAVVSKLTEVAFLPGATFAEQITSIDSIPKLLNVMEEVLGMVYLNEDSIVQTILKDVTGQDLGPDYVIVKNAAYAETSLIDNFEPKVDGMMQGLVKNILTAVRPRDIPDQEKYLTLQEVLKNGGLSATLTEFIEVAEGTVDKLLWKDESLLGSTTLSLFPVAMESTLNFMMGPIETQSVSLYLLFLYQYIGTICMAFSLSWMAARHYEVKRAKKYGIPRRDLGIPMLAGRCCSSKAKEARKAKKAGKGTAAEKDPKSKAGTGPVKGPVAQARNDVIIVASDAAQEPMIDTVLPPAETNTLEALAPSPSPEVMRLPEKNATDNKMMAIPPQPQPAAAKPIASPASLPAMQVVMQQQPVAPNPIASKMSLPAMQQAMPQQAPSYEMPQQNQPPIQQALPQAPNGFNSLQYNRGRQMNPMFPQAPSSPTFARQTGGSMIGSQNQAYPSTMYQGLDSQGRRPSAWQ